MATSPRGSGVCGRFVDQIAAKHMAQDTQLASLELCLDSRDFVGTCDAGYACAYGNTISCSADALGDGKRSVQSSSVCSATAGAPALRPGLRASGETAAFSTR